MKKLPHVFIRSEFIGVEKIKNQSYEYKSGEKWMVPKEIQDWINENKIEVWFEIIHSHTTALIFGSEEDKASFLLVWGGSEHITHFSKINEGIFNV